MGRPQLSPVSVVLVTHNSEAHIQASLEALTQDPAGPSEIVVVDNASEDRTVAIVEQFGVKSVRLDENRGFPYGCNLGASLTSGPVVAFVNPDTEPHPGWLAPRNRSRISFSLVPSPSWPRCWNKEPCLMCKQGKVNPATITELHEPICAICDREYRLKPKKSASFGKTTSWCLTTMSKKMTQVKKTPSLRH